MSKKKQIEPLFYIQQPTIQFPKTKMQEFYSSKKAEIEKNTRELTISPKQSTESVSKSVEKSEEIQGGKNASEAQYREKDNKSSLEIQTKRKGGYSFQRVKSFKEMNTLERIDYLIDFPKQMPPVPCIFEVEGKIIRGFLLSKTKEQIEIKDIEGKIEAVQIQSLKEIKMAGL